MTLSFRMPGFAAAVLACGLILAGLFAPVSSVRAAEPERCFGAAGQGCGGWDILAVEMPRFAFCVSIPVVGLGACKVSGGSMTHDPCCVANPDGEWCGVKPERNVCRAEWNRAVHRATWAYQWTRAINMNLGNSTGRVDRPKYCANRGSGVHKDDVSFCCSSRARNAFFWENVGRPSLRICE